MYLVSASPTHYCSRKKSRKLSHCCSHLIFPQHKLQLQYKKKKEKREEELYREELDTNLLGHESSIWVINDRRKCAIIVQEHNYLLSFGGINYLLKHLQC